MSRYVIERNLGKVNETELQQAAARSKRTVDERFPDVRWEHSHVIRTDDGLKTLCVYEAADPKRILEHAKAAGLPADRIYEIVTDVDPAGI